MKKRKKVKPKTPTRAMLLASSALQPSVASGLIAVEQKDRKYIDTKVRKAFNDSLNLDKAMQPQYPQENRWDYLLGHKASGDVIGLEPHSAKEDQVSKVIKKRRKALEHLRDHLRQGKQVADWCWVASSSVEFADTEKTRIRLADNGINFVGTRLLERHLPGAPTARRGRTRK